MTARPLLRALLRQGELLRSGRSVTDEDIVLIERADLEGLDALDLRQIRQEAERNARLALAARKGVAAARATIERARNGERVECYDGSGRRARILREVFRVERRF